MIDMQSSCRPTEDVVDTRLEDGRTALLNLVSKTYYSLNPTGTVIWEGLKKSKPLSEISTELQRRYDVDAGRAEASILRLLNELSEQQLVRID